MKFLIHKFHTGGFKISYTTRDSGVCPFVFQKLILVLMSPFWFLAWVCYVIGPCLFKSNNGKVRLAKASQSCYSAPLVVLRRRWGPVLSLHLYIQAFFRFRQLAKTKPWPHTVPLELVMGLMKMPWSGGHWTNQPSRCGAVTGLTLCSYPCN